MCDACKCLSKIYDGSQRLMVTRYTNRKTGNPIFLLVQENEEGAQAVNIAVKYCPWCGQKLLKGGES